VGGFAGDGQTEIFENSYLRKSIDDFQAAVNQDVNNNAIPLNDANY
jgi:hypothetical protein